MKVIDVGLAKAIADGGREMDLTRDGFIGTPAFASPEQFSGAPADVRSDIYSLGMTLWYALTGAVPYEGKTIGEIPNCQSDLPLPVQKLGCAQEPDSRYSPTAPHSHSRSGQAAGIGSRIDGSRGVVPGTLGTHPRMGIHGGPVNEVADVNEQTSRRVR